LLAYQLDRDIDSLIDRAQVAADAADMELDVFRARMHHAASLSARFAACVRSRSGVPRGVLVVTKTRAQATSKGAIPCAAEL